jgi:hypothetical protein
MIATLHCTRNYNFSKQLGAEVNFSSLPLYSNLREYTNNKSGNYLRKGRKVGTLPNVLSLSSDSALGKVIIALCVMINRSYFFKSLVYSGFDKNILCFTELKNFYAANPQPATITKWDKWD